MDPKLKRILRAVSLEIRRLLEGRYDEHGKWQAGDLERRLNELGVWRERNAKPADEMPHLSSEDKLARRLVDGYLKLREEAGVGREAAVSEFVRESAYTWANRLFALRCMEARGIVDEVILQKDSYGGRSLAHFRFAKKTPDACAGYDDGLFAVLFAEFAERAKELPLLFDPKSPAVALRPSIAALKRTIALLSGRETARGQNAATDDVFASPDAFGWAYQYWNADEKDRVFEMVRTKKGAKIQGADIIPATQLYTEPYMVKFLVQNSLGALWMSMYPDSKLCEHWEYFVKDADRAPVARKPVCEVTFLDPAEGSGHFHLEAFDLFYAMYAEEAAREGRTLTPRESCAAILNQNLYGIDIDGRSVQIATAALWMKAKERAPELEAGYLTSFHDHLVATNIRLPRERNHLELFLQKHPEDEQLRPALELVFQGLEHADELGALLQIEELVDTVLRRLKAEADKSKGTAVQTRLFEPTLVQGTLPVNVEDYDRWKRDSLNRLQAHFESEALAADAAQAFFGEAAGKGLILFELLSRRYDVVVANPPYMGENNVALHVKAYLKKTYPNSSADLYACFIERGLSLSTAFVAEVTLHTWMFLTSFVDLRRALLNKHSVRAIVQLGRYAFDEADPPGNPCMLVVSNVKPEGGHTFSALRIGKPMLASEQARILRWQESARPAFKETDQLSLLKIDDAPIVLGVPDKLLHILTTNDQLGSRGNGLADVLMGSSTKNDTRFLRWFWEVAQIGQRWQRFAKGGRYQKWCGLNTHVIDWEEKGARPKTSVLERYPYLNGNYGWVIKYEDWHFAPGLTYTNMARGSLGVRLLDHSIAGHSSHSIFSRTVPRVSLASLLNSRVASVLLRMVTQSLTFETGYVARLPIVMPDRLATPGDIALEAKAAIVSYDLLEHDFQPRTWSFEAPKLRESLTPQLLSTFLYGARLHTAEAAIEAIVFELYALDEESREFVFAETGTPAGFFQTVDGYATCPNEELSRLDVVHSSLSRSVPSDRYDALKRKLREAFENGNVEPVSDEEPTEDEAEQDKQVAGGRRIPNETFLEVLSQRLELHPVSVYWLLKEGMERDGWCCPPEERRLTEDRFTMMMLRLLGHRWPKQLEAGEPLPPWADADGVIPLTSGGNETPLIERVRERLAEDFPGGNVAALEREFGEIVGTPLKEWLSGPFFARHISQFKKRPIAWQIETDARGQRSGSRKKKRGEVAKPVFACLVYYQKLHAGLLPKIRTHYAEASRGGHETELRTLERLGNPTPDQQGRKLQLDQWIEELKAFEVKLEQVSQIGFGPTALRPTLRQYAINDSLLSLTACWLRRLEWGVRSGEWEQNPHPGPLPLGEGEASVASSGGILVAWQNAAADTELHADLPAWISEAFARLDFFCGAVGTKPPSQEAFDADPTSPDLAPFVCASAAKTVAKVLGLACERWWQKFDENVLAPLKEELKRKKEEHERVKMELELDEVKLDYDRLMQLAERRDELKKEVKWLREDIQMKTDKAETLRSQIRSWTCPEAETWENWLGTLPLFDAIASLDGKRSPPATIAEFIAQESAYVPDINDGVRVNIAPLQQAGLLHADVLDSKDAEKAISDRAEWRADERRWVREGKLPQPGWWETTKSTT